MQPYLTILWFVFVLLASVIAIVIWQRRRHGGAVFGLVVFGGALGSYALFLSDPSWRLIGLGAVVAFGVGCLGLIRDRTRPDRCHVCGYDFTGTTGESGARCPECGAGRLAMKGHCMECKADIRQAIAGGSIKCPFCSAEISPDQRRGH